MLTTVTGKTVANLPLISHWRASLSRCAEENDEPKTPRTQNPAMRAEEVVQHAITNQPTPQETLGGFAKILEETDQTKDH